jgi:glycosyltransferase involved in cell wall biosynthesis
MIFLDAERFLAEAVESVLAQRGVTWELLLVDDGSTDAGTQRARSYVEADQGRVRYLEHPGHRNRGMSASRNLGIAAAEGELVADAPDPAGPPSTPTTGGTTTI